MNYTVSLAPAPSATLTGFTVGSIRDLDRFHGRLHLRLQDAINALAANPRPPRCLKMKGRDEWRIPVGQYRILYLIDDAARQVTVAQIGHRREVYER